MSCLSTFEAESFCFYCCYKCLSHRCNLVLYGSYISGCHDPPIVMFLPETLASKSGFRGYTFPYDGFKKEVSGCGVGIFFLSRLILILRIKSDSGSPGFYWRESREEEGSCDPEGGVSLSQAWVAQR